MPLIKSINPGVHPHFSRFFLLQGKSPDFTEIHLVKPFIKYLFFFAALCALQTGFSQEEWERHASGEYVRDIIEDDKSIWIGTSSGLIRFDKLSKETTNFNTVNSKLPDNDVSALAFDHDGWLWVGTGYGLARVRGDEWEAIPMVEIDGRKLWKVYCLEVSTDGKLWAGTSLGLFWYQDGDWGLVTPSDDGLPCWRGDVKLAASDGSIWVYSCGLVNISADGVYTDYSSSFSGPEIGFILDLVEMKDGTICFITGSGFYTIKDNEFNFILIEGISPGISLGKSLVVDADDRLWLSVSGIGPISGPFPSRLIVMDVEGNVLEEHVHPTYTSVLLAAEDGGVYAFSGYQELREYEGENNWIEYDLSTQDLAGVITKQLAFGPNGEPVVSSVRRDNRAYVQALQGDRWNTLYETDRTIYSLASSQSGELFVRTDDSLITITASGVESTLLPLEVKPFSEAQSEAVVDSWGRLWVDFSQRFQPNGDPVRYPTEKEGIAVLQNGVWSLYEPWQVVDLARSDAIKSLQVDEKDHIWALSFSEGLVEFTGTNWVSHGHPFAEPLYFSMSSIAYDKYREGVWMGS